MKITKEKIYFHAPYRMLLSNMDKITGLGINCEIYADANALDTCTEAEIETVNLTFEKGGLKKIAHGPFMDLNPGSRDPKIRDLTLKRMLAALEFCEKIKADHMVLHSGFDPIFYKDTSELFMELSVPVWREVVDAAALKGIVIALENSIDPTPKIVIDLLTEISSPNFEACFDAGHFNAFGEMSVFEALREYPPRSIGELHLSDNKGDFDTHLALGEGDIDYPRFFKEIAKMEKEPIFTSEPHSPNDIEKNLEYLISLNI